MAQYSNDGDNTQEAQFMVGNVLEYFKEIDSKDNKSFVFCFLFVPFY